MTIGTLAWAGATTWRVGENAVEQSLQALAVTGPIAPALIVDAGWATTSAGIRLRSRILRALPNAPVDEVLISGPITVEELRSLIDRWHRARATSIVAVGGGTVIDAACLSALPKEQLSAPGFCRGRSGLVMVPTASRPALTRLVVPTTLGTGAELSSTACCEGPDGKLLVLGEELRPEFAAVHPAATSGLPVGMVRGAVVEVLARLLVPFTAVPTGAAGVVRVADAHVLADLDTLARVAAGGIRCGFNDDSRLTVAAVSAHSHAGWGTLGRGLFASPLWFVATELSAALRVSKAKATALLLPAWASAVLAGDDRWGGATRLRAGWRAVVEAHGDGEPVRKDRPSNDARSANRARSADPADGLTEFCLSVAQPDGAVGGGTDQDWKETADQVAATCLRRWGAGLPMLGSLDYDALVSVVWQALSRQRAPTAAAGMARG